MSKDPWNEKNIIFTWVSSLYNPFTTKSILDKVIFIIANRLDKSLFRNFNSWYKEPLFSSASKYIPFYNSTYPDNIYLFEIYVYVQNLFKVNIKNFEHISQLAQVFLYQTLNK